MRTSVSIVIPVRNEADNIEALLRDVLGQSYEADEIIVVDTGSRDLTRPRVEEVAAANRRVRLISISDGFPGAGRNAGIRAARSEWIAFIDAGMRVDREWLASLIAPIACEPVLDIVLGGLEPIVESRAQRAAALAYVPARRATPAGGTWRGFCLPSSAIRRDLALRIGGFPEALRSGEDLWFYRRAAERARIGYAPDAIVRWSHASTPKAVWRRFRSYAEHSFRGGLMEDWFDITARRYLMAVIAGGAVAPAVVAAMLLARAAVMQRRKPEFVDHDLPGRLRQAVEVAFYLGIIDAAAVAAWFSWRRNGAERLTLTVPAIIDEPRAGAAEAR